METMMYQTNNKLELITPEGTISSVDYVPAYKRAFKASLDEENKDVVVRKYDEATGQQTLYRRETADGIFYFGYSKGGARQTWFKPSDDFVKRIGYLGEFNSILWESSQLITSRTEYAIGDQQQKNTLYKGFTKSGRSIVAMHCEAGEGSWFHVWTADSLFAEFIASVANVNESQKEIFRESNYNIVPQQCK